MVAIAAIVTVDTINRGHQIQKLEKSDERYKKFIVTILIGFDQD